MFKSRIKKMSKPIVNEDLCIGCGTCESLCGSVFKIEGGKSHVVSDQCGDCDLQEAVDSCPVSAISIEE
jgi:ferredoxin